MSNSQTSPVNILCFGDSNTWGLNSPAGQRFDYNSRWPRILSNILGDAATVYENGVCGRTTVFEDPISPGRCGLSSLEDALRVNEPLDLLILNLGTNDTKSYFQASSPIIASGLELLVRTAQNPSTYTFGVAVSKILIISPIILSDDVEEKNPLFGYNATSIQSSKELASHYKRIADLYGCLFLDSSKLVSPCDFDGIHMDASGHRVLAEEIAKIIKKEFSI